MEEYPSSYPHLGASRSSNKNVQSSTALYEEYSSGMVEGLNYKVELTIRKAYGFRQQKVAEIALYHVLGDLPEPKLTHEFC